MKPLLVFLLLLVASIGYEPENPPTIQLKCQGRRYEIVPLLELRGDSIRVIQNTWIQLDEIEEFQDYGRHHPVWGILLGGCVGSCIGFRSAVEGKHLFSMSNEDEAKVPLYTCGGGLGGAALGCLILRTQVHDFRNLSPEERRNVVRSILGETKEEGN